MHLYMYSEFSKEIANISLKDGCRPAIGDQVSDQLEPAVWFKVLVLDAVSIDCNKRHVLWHTSTDLQHVQPIKGEQHRMSKSSTMEPREIIVGGVSVKRRESRRVVERQISESVYAAGECMGYNSDMDEVYDFTQDALSKFANGEISQSDFNKDIFRLLHIHILPNIRLSADDIINVQDAGGILDTFIKDMDELILESQNKIDRVQQDMRKQRFRFVEDLCEPDSLCKYSLPMSTLLHQQISHDISAAHEQLEDMTRLVEAAKESVLSSGESQDSTSTSGSSAEEDLSRLRQKRDKFLIAEFNKLLTSRAVLDEHIKTFNDIATTDPSRASTVKSGKGKKSKSRNEKEKRRKKKCKGYIPSDEDNPLYATYMGMDQTQKDLIEKIQLLAHYKVLQLSVKETIRGVLEVLLCGQETSGVDMDPTGTQRPTDVLRHSRIPMEWLSLAEQVSTVIQDANLKVAQNHKQFCENVKSTCITAIQKQKLCNLSQSIDVNTSPSSLTTCDGGLYAENKLYNITHGPLSERSSGFSSSFHSEASRSAEFTPSGSFAVGQCATPGSVHAPRSQLISQGSSCEVLSFHPDGSRSSKSSVQSNPQEPGCMVSKAVLGGCISVEDTSVHVASMYHQDHADYTILETSDIILVEDNDELEGTVEKLKLYIMRQFEDICGELQDQLGYNGDVYFKKLWQCYETHFFTETMELLSRLYIEAYASKFQHVLDSLYTMTAGDLDLTGFIVNTLEDLSCFPDIRARTSFTNSVDHQSSPCGTLAPGSLTCSSEHTTTPTGGSDRDSPDSSHDEQNKNSPLAFSVPVAVITDDKCTESMLVLDQQTIELDVMSQQQDHSQNTPSTTPQTEVNPQGTTQQTEVTPQGTTQQTGVCPQGTTQQTGVSPQHTTQKTGVSPQGTTPQIEVSPQGTTQQTGVCPATLIEQQGETQRERPLSMVTMVTQDTCDPGEQIQTDRTSHDHDRASHVKLTRSLDRHLLAPSGEPVVSSSASSSLQGASSGASLTSSQSSQDQSSVTSSSEQSISSREDHVTPVQRQRQQEEEERQGVSHHAVRISCPTSTTLIYDRHTWPLLLQDPVVQPDSVIHEPDSVQNGDLENGDNNNKKVFTVTPLSPTIIARGKSTQFKKCVKEQFKGAFNFIDEALKDSSPLLKLQQLVRCLKEINTQYQKLQTQFCGKSSGVCADELIDILVLFLCNVQIDTARKLYAHIMLLSHFLPRFFEGGPFSFTLVQFSAAFQVLQDRLLIKTKKHGNESEV